MKEVLVRCEWAEDKGLSVDVRVRLSEVCVREITEHR